MKKFLLTVLLMSSVLFVAFAKDAKERTSEVSMGSFMYVDSTFDDKIAEFNFQTYVQFQKDLNQSKYAGFRLGCAALAKKDLPSSEYADKGAFGLSAQGVYGFAKTLKQKDNFRIRGFADAAVGILITAGGVSEISDATYSSEDGGPDFDSSCFDGTESIEYLLTVTPSVGVSFELDSLCAKLFVSNNIITDLEPGTWTVGVSAGIRW